MEWTWNDIDEDKIVKAIDNISHDPKYHFMKDFKFDTFKEKYKTLIAEENEGEYEEAFDVKDDEKWTKNNSHHESEDETEEITIHCTYMEEKKINVKIYRENADVYIATISETKLEQIEALTGDCDEHKIRENITIILNKMYSEAKNRIDKGRELKEKPTFIHMDNDEDQLTMVIM